MPFNLGGLLSSGLSGAQEAVEKILVQFEADTSSLDAAMAKLDQQVAKEEAQRTKALASVQAAHAKALALEADYSAKSQQLSAARAHAAEMAIMGVTQATDVEVAALQKEVMAKAAAVQQAQIHERAIVQETRALDMHIGMLKADQAALQQRAATGSVGPSGISSAGAAGIGAVSAMASMAAMSAVQGLARAVEQTALAYVHFGHEVEHTARLMNSSAEQASVLLYTFQHFNLDAGMATRVILQLSRHVEDNEDKFVKLGVATRDATGHFRNAYEILQSVRQVLSQSADGIEKNDAMMKLLARSGAGGGTAFAELNAIMSLTDDQMTAVEAEARRMGFVLDTEAAKKAYKLQQDMQGLGLSLRGAQIAISQWMVPALTSLVDWLVRAIATAQFASKSFDNLGISFARAASGWLNFVGNLVPGGRAAAGLVDALIPADASQRLDDFVNDAVEGFKKIGALIDPTGGPAPELSNKKDRSAADEIREQIAAIEEQARVTQDALREELSNFTATHQAEIDLIKEQSSDAKAAHDAQIAAIEEEKRVASDAFNDRQQQRQDEIGALREKLATLQETWRVEDAQRSLAAAQKALTHDSGIGVFRTKGMTEEAYQQAVANQNKRILADEQKVADEKRKIARDETKFKIEEQIKAIEAVGTAERRRLDEFRKGKDEEVRTIRAQMKLEADASAAAVKGIQDQMKAEKDRVEDRIKGMQKETRDVVALLKEQLKGATELASGFRAVAAAATAAAQAIINVDQAQRRGERGGASIGGGGWGGGSSVNPDDLTTWPSVPGFANGGSMVLTDPTLLVSERSGRVLARAAENGPEPVSFGDGGGDITIRVPVSIDGQVVTEVVVDRVARALGRRAGWGWGRKG